MTVHAQAAWDMAALLVSAIAELPVNPRCEGHF